ncbi:MAG: peptide transporter, partial [Planctomycetes bacterium]|nr:peptide transporter [Planctomycetota bacterium]
MPEETKVKHEESFQVMPEDAPFESGFNWSTLWAALFVGFVMIPGAIYLGLVNGQNIAGGAEWVTIILFIEIAKRSFVRLRTQEIIIIYWIAGGLVTAGSAGHALFGGPFGAKIWDQYLVSSPQAYGLREYIPGWLCPSIKSSAIADRTFWHSDWLTPILLIVVGGILGRVCGLAMGYVMYVVTNDLQRLTFPMARVYAFGATALAETSAKKEGWRWQVFSIGSFLGAMFGLIYTVVPTLSGVFLTDTVTILPIPFIDFTPSVKAILPATALGLNTNLGELLVGFVLPFWIVVGTFVTSMLTTFIVNPLLFKYGILTSWAPGMTTIPTRVCNDVDFWISFSIGKTLVVAALGIWLAGKALSGGSLKGWGDEGAASTPPEKLPPGRGHCPIWLALLLWGVCTAGFIWITYLLVPDFPWWICALFGFIWSPLLSLITAMMIGITGQTG